MASYTRRPEHRYLKSKEAVIIEEKFEKQKIQEIKKRVGYITKTKVNFENIKENYKVEKLKRYRKVNVPKEFKGIQKEYVEKMGSYVVPNGLVDRLFGQAVNGEIYRWVFTRMIFECLASIKEENIGKNNDDIIRKIYKKYEEKIKLEIFEGISVIGGPSGWEKDELAAKAKEWVVGSVDWGLKYKDSIVGKIREIVSEWVMNEKSASLSFNDFCNDPIRWGTAGGAPKSKMYDQRSKWAWAIERTKNGKDLEKELGVIKNVATVALKEESKTRLIISAPLDSYVRQKYIEYVFGKPKNIPMVASHENKYIHFLKNHYQNYLCWDATKFDQQIPKWVVMEFFQAIEDKTTNQEVKRVACMEKWKIRDLRVQVFDQIYLYEHGILSGWYYTNLLDSLCSYLFAWHMGFTDDQMIVQGDDVMVVNSKVDLQQTLEIAKDFGFELNQTKSTHGVEGEFLRKKHKKEMITGIPLRIVGSICYAKPWLKGEGLTAEDCKNNWFTLISRTERFGIKYKNFEFEIASDIARLVRSPGVGKNEIISVLRTPSDIGGMGTAETSNINDRRGFKLEQTNVDARFEKSGLAVLEQILGLTKEMEVRQTKIRNVWIPTQVEEISDGGKEIVFQKDENKTYSIINFIGFENKYTGKTKEIKNNEFPKAVRYSNMKAKIEWIMGVGNLTCTGSWRGGNEIASKRSARYSKSVSSWLYNRKHLSKNIVGYAQRMITHMMYYEWVPYMTW